jgi:hypothetical protein
MKNGGRVTYVKINGTRVLETVAYKGVSGKKYQRIMRVKCHCVLLILGMLWQEASGQTCCSGGVPISNNIGGLPISSQKTWQFSLNGDANVLKTVKEGTRVLNDRARDRKTLSLLFKTGYSFTDKVFVEGLFSWVQQERTIQQATGFSDFDRSRGLGDAVILVNYNYLTIGNTKLIGALGSKMPTGSSDLKDDDGLMLNADLQPGTGAWDGMVLHRIQASDKLKPSRFYFINGTFRFTGKNKNYLGSEHYRFGNEVQLLAGATDQFLIGSALISSGINVRYRSVRRDWFNNELLPNTGGTWLFLMPLIGWHISPDLVLNLNGELPLYANVKGTQLSPTFRINGGVYYVYSKRN